MLNGYMTYAKTEKTESLTVSNIDIANATLLSGDGYNDVPVFYVKNVDIYMPFAEEEHEHKSNYNNEPAEVIPGGMTVGIRINTSGVMVLGTDYISDQSGTSHKPTEGVLYPGDLIISVNGRLMENKEVLREEIGNSKGDIKLRLKRDGELLEKTIEPIKCQDSRISRIGAWVRDSTQGIGTITYINPDSMKFGALGHGIMDVDTKKLMSIKSGEVTNADVISVKKGKRGSPGELVGDIMLGEHFGDVKMNNAYGLFGVVNSDAGWLNKPRMAIAEKDEVVTGPATMLTNIGSSEVSEYDIIIETINRNSGDDSKGLIIRIVDDRLLDKTNGIVQGMSGSPIIQNGKFVGAVTHVFVQEPTKGYGIFIEHMLKQENGF